MSSTAPPNEPTLSAAVRALTMEVDGQEVAFQAGESVYEVTQRCAGEQVPTLCYDPRLEAFGACRLCVVELEGARNPVASCTTQAQAGMKVKTRTEKLERYRKTLVEMVASENRETSVDALSGHSSQELKTLVTRYAVDGQRFCGHQSGTSNERDDNPFILRDYDNCISCYRCVRVCAEQEGDYAISVMNRGFHTQITTEFENNLKDSACTFCGQCVQTCPTGALSDRKALRAREVEGEIQKTRTVCPYCGVGCSVDILTKGEKIVGIQPAMDGAANQGALCVKGQFAFDFVQHADRLKKPLLRQPDGTFREVDWDTALEAAAAGFREALRRHGRRSVYGIASGRAPHEAAYTMQKFIRAGTGTHHIDNCSRA